MRAADELELVVAPVGPLRPLVLAGADRLRLPRERLASVRRVELDLDQLPVALVRVVPVVEGVEEPVLEREAARPVGLRGHVRVDRRLVPFVMRRAQRSYEHPRSSALPGVERALRDVVRARVRDARMREVPHAENALVDKRDRGAFGLVARRVVHVVARQLAAEIARRA